MSRSAKREKKMTIYNTDTNEEIKLTYAPTGCDCLQDLTASDTSITYNDEEDRYEADSTAIEWWDTWVSKQEFADQLVAAAKDEFGAGEVQDALQYAGDCDLEDQPNAIRSAIEKLAEENEMAVKSYDDGSIGLVEKSSA